MDTNGIDLIYKIGINLRKNFKTFISYEPKKLQKHLNVADNSNARICLCIGENELNNDKIWLKDLEQKREMLISRSDLNHELERILNV